MYKSNNILKLFKRKSIIKIKNILKIKNIAKINEKIDKVNNDQLKKSFNNLIKTFNEKSFKSFIFIIFILAITPSSAKQ